MTHSQPPFGAICFDCDSTLSRIEGVDELAVRAGVESEIAPLTEAAMNGELSIDQVYAKRLQIVKPDRASMIWLAGRYLDEVVAGARETIQTLQNLGKAVHVISGGFLPAVRPFALELGVAPDNVHAVDLMFDDEGNYNGFDETSPLYTPDGKAHICRPIAERHDRIAMVGDGLTDLAARAAGACVVGFGGVANRKVVAEGADHFISSANLTETLNVLLTDGERSRS